MGVSGDVTHIEHAVSAVLSQNREPVTVTLITGEIGVQALLKTNRKVSLSIFYYILPPFCVPCLLNGF